ncbi:PAS domain-containing protein [Permianibacter sp. IMCC34836]|uniref:nitrogen regulation protein NR(II) n=1 Tax=Permianibacter fluminis TaxID=2738515 RepID=UPI0015530975|nr:nitrogen regulation protein NR(II) [Permianibacter fluminis]NQD36185.1 PAS domain-containing protein [Permianibacter fluminis]
MMNAEALLDSLTTAVLQLDAETRLVAVNSAAENLFGHSRRRLLGTELGHWLPSPQPALELLQRAHKEQRTCHGHDLMLALPFAATARIEVLVTPLPDGWLLELRPLDDSQRRHNETERARQQQELHELLRALAHEIKNPLAGLRGAAQLLARELVSQQGERDGSEPALTDYTDLIQREADRLRALVDRLLLPARTLTKQPLNIHSVLEQVLQIVRLTLPAGVQLQRDYDPSLPDLVANADALHQVMLNLLQNAADAIGEQGRISLRTRAEHGVTLGSVRWKLVLRLDVIDNGAGVPADLRDRIFLPLVTGKAHGTGLGLSIAQTLVQQHDGLLECSSEPGNTVFTVWLPWRDPNKPEPRASANPNSIASNISNSNPNNKPNKTEPA